VVEIQSAFVSQVEPIEFGELAGAVEVLSGQEIASGRSRLQINDRSGSGLAGAVYYRGTLRTGSPLIPTVKVEIVVSPWSSTKSEIGIRPLTNLGRFDSMRSNRFYSAARAVVQALFDQVFTDLSFEDSASLVLAA
jgi:hypothetical protein